MSKPQFDDKDSAILAERIASWDARKGARVGDWCRMPDGELRRFTHDWGDELQTNTPQFGLGSFYFGDGYMSYSGALDPAVPRSQLRKTAETKPGVIWFFHHDHQRAHNGVYCEVSCRVFEVVS